MDSDVLGRSLPTLLRGSAVCLVKGKVYPRRFQSWEAGRVEVSLICLLWSKAATLGKSDLQISESGRQPAKDT